MKILIVSDTHRRDGNLTQVLDMVGQIDLLILIILHPSSQEQV